MPGLCGHPTGPSGKLCNNNAGDCRTHLRREQQLMACEDRSSGIAGRGFRRFTRRNFAVSMFSGELSMIERARIEIGAKTKAATQIQGMRPLMWSAGAPDHRM